MLLFSSLCYFLFKYGAEDLDITPRNPRGLLSGIQHSRGSTRSPFPSKSLVIRLISFPLPDPCCLALKCTRCLGDFLYHYSPTSLFYNCLHNFFFFFCPRTVGVLKYQHGTLGFLSFPSENKPTSVWLSSRRFRRR